MGKKSSYRKKGQSATHAHLPILHGDPPVVREVPLDPPTIHGANANGPAPQIASSSISSQVPSGHCIPREGSNTNTPILPHQGSTPTVGSQQANSSQINEYRVQCRILIEPHGDQTSATMSNIMERHFNGPWKSFREVPIENKNLWFEKFEELACPSHTSGSISFSKHVERAWRAKGDSFDYLQLHDDLHTIKSGPNKGQLVSEKSRKISEKVHSLKADLESSENSVTQQKDINELFVETNNELFVERKKGRICGLGSEAAGLLRPPMSSSISSSISHAMKLAEMQKKMDEMAENEKALQKKLNVMTENGEKMKMIISRMKKENSSRDFLMRNLYSQMGIPVPHVDDMDNSDDEDVGFSLVDHHPSVASGSNPPPPPPPSAAAPTHSFG